MQARWDASDMKTVIVTGAKGGLGSFVTNAFLNAGREAGGLWRTRFEAVKRRTPSAAAESRCDDHRGAVAPRFFFPRLSSRSHALRGNASRRRSASRAYTGRGGDGGPQPVRVAPRSGAGILARGTRVLRTPGSEENG